MQKFKEFDEKEVSKLKNHLDRFAQKYSISTDDVLKFFETGNRVPVCIFSSKFRLSPLESVVKYLRQNLGMKYPEIAGLLGKGVSVCWTAYRNAVRKIPKKISCIPSRYDIPLKKLSSPRLSLLESICCYLKDEHNLSYNAIGRLMARNERTIWTACNRARKKMKIKTKVEHEKK